MAYKTSNRVAMSAVSLAVSVLFGTAAHSAVYPARFDPGGNGSFIPGFTGDALFDISDACLTSGWKPTTGSGGCTASTLGAITYLYSTSPSDPPFPGVVLDSFTLGSFPVLGVLAAGGVVTGVDTDPMGPVSNDGDFYEGLSFWLQFVSGACDPAICIPTPPGTPPVGSELFLTSGKVPGDPAFIFVGSPDLAHRSSPARVIFGPACADPDPTLTTCVVSPVPEPGVLSLILASLGGAWLARRRKRPA